jgi:hypothetical protein
MFGKVPFDDNSLGIYPTKTAGRFFAIPGCGQIAYLLKINCCFISGFGR